VLTAVVYHVVGYDDIMTLLVVARPCALGCLCDKSDMSAIGVSLSTENAQTDLNRSGGTTSAPRFAIGNLVAAGCSLLRG
jgi:hypothetical protein